jgi:DNA-directed RNA polymerase specialized sigma24 family protein
MNRETYRLLRIKALRLTRRGADADDLVQDTLLAALEAGRSDAAWLAGTLQRQALMTARSAVRRRRREALVAMEFDEVAPATAIENAPAKFVLTLPKAARRIATLALHGLDADEIRWIAGVTPAAFRQRLTSIRKALAALPAPLRQRQATLAITHEARVGAHAFGLLRRALKSALHGRDGLGTHDADGHLLVLRPAGAELPKTFAHGSSRGGNHPAPSEEKGPC